ncbi:MAG: hypothetical protein HYV29_07090 [Ignavibacteriales bacterium]|nr:hypothetical protein [Ignavibacteriales bacterium]
MRSFPVYFLMIIAATLTGCYTEFAASESSDYSDDGYYTDTDTTYDDEGTVTINNNYYLDDDYRRSRFRLSFNYYYPTYHSSWISGYYHSFYDDYYWGWHRPWWWYHHYPQYTIIYPNPWWPPIYDPWYPYPYYPGGVYYPPYYSPPQYGYNPPANPGRVRTDGSTRDPRDPGGRTRPIPTPTTPGTTIATGGTPARERIPEVKAIPVDERQREEIPWWKKVNSTSPPEKRARVVDGTDKQSPRDNRTMTSPPQKKAQREDQPAYTPPKNKQREQKRVNEGATNKPAYNPPRRSVPQNEGKSSDRPREERRTYSPPPAQQAPPQSSPPRSNGGSSGGSGNGGGRKRAD